MHERDFIGDAFAILVPVLQGLKVFWIVARRRELGLLAFKEAHSLGRSREFQEDIAELLQGCLSLRSGIHASFGGQLRLTICLRRSFEAFGAASEGAKSRASMAFDAQILL